MGKMKTLTLLLLASMLFIPKVSGGELKTAWQDKKFEAYLPPLPIMVPWLSLDRRTRLPQGDYPLGRDVESLGPLVLQSPSMQQADLAEMELGGS